MASHREIVMVQGQLSGMGCKASCVVSAVKVSLPGTSLSEFAKCNIHHAPDELPDGQYQVTFEGRTAQVKKQNGNWLAWGF